MNDIARLVLGVIVIVAAGCAKGGSGGSSNEGGGGEGATMSNGSNDGGNDGNGGDDPGQGGAPPLTDLQSICEAGCTNVEQLSNQVGCSPTPDCVASCVNYGESLTTCRSAYEQLMACAVGEMSTQTCDCSPSDGNILSCALCPAQLDAFQGCIAFKDDGTN